MASAFGRSPRDLIRELRAQGPRFGFFQAVRVLALTARYQGEKIRQLLPRRLRFRTTASLAFPASEVTQYRPLDVEAYAAGQRYDELEATFMGLTGPSAVLPRPYTEQIIARRLYHRDTGLHAFLDIFNHRAIALFYGAWRKYRYWLAVEGGETDGFTRNLLDFSGVGLRNLRMRLGGIETAGVDENIFVYYAGLLSQKPLSAQAIVTLVQGFFGVRAQLDQFVGQWIEVPLTEQSRLGENADELGLSAFAGDFLWDRQTGIRLRLGPMASKPFEQLLPGEPGEAALRALVRFMVGYGLSCNVTLTLERSAMREPCLTPDNPLILGGNVWLPLPERVSDPDDACYRLLE
ncbi:MAG: type VI secretion system baseplate subunit TssG [Azoarcus sp.]|jgi:type VI secretion system protein ImpH|nr:type VI secretion system baseplate subunit TssG [Azoarcus sp.]